MTAIFFDLDGTLTDPKEGITKSVQYALDEMGKVVPKVEDLLCCIGPPLRVSLTKFLKNSEEIERAMLFFQKRYGTKGLYENILYEDINSLLSELKNNNFKLYVATSKPHVYATKIIHHFGLSDYFESIFGSELDGTRSTKTQLLEHALSRIGCNPKGSYMVGDRMHDAIGAINNDMIPIGVLYGYGSKEELENADVRHLARKPKDILKIVAE